MKMIAVFMLVALSLNLCAQGDAQRTQPLIDAEHAFIKMAREKNTRDAFIAFLSDSAIMFSEKGPRKGKAHFFDQQPNESLLAWDACYTDMSLSGDWGLNIGPWNYRPKKTDSVAVAYGHFVTVWRKEKDNQWRAIIDIGISHARISEEDNLKSSKIKSAPTKTSISEAFAIEENFNKSQLVNAVDAYKKTISAEARVLRTNETPLTTTESIIKKVGEQKSHEYKLHGGEVSPKGDMFYTYGTVDVESIVEGKSQTKQHNYVRIWKNEEANGWRIVIEIVS